MNLIKYLLLAIIFLQLECITMPRKPILIGNSQVYAKKDSLRIRRELYALKKRNKDLYDLSVDLSHFIQRQFKKDIIVVMIYRTQGEQNWLYRNSRKYKEQKFISPHQMWHAVDIRSRIFTKTEIKQVVDYINEKYDKSNFYRWTAKYHSVGSGYHFHFQYTKKQSHKK